MIIYIKDVVLLDNRTVIYATDEAKLRYMLIISFHHVNIKEEIRSILRDTKCKYEIDRICEFGINIRYNPMWLDIILDNGVEYVKK